MITSIYKILAQILLVVVLAGTIWFLVKKNKDLSTQLASAKQTTQSYATGLQTYKDKYGTLHNTSLLQQQRIGDLQASKDSVVQTLLDSVAKYNIKLKNVEGLGKVQTKLEVRTIREYKYRDTTLDFSQPPHILETIKIDSGKVTRDLAINNTMSLIWHKYQERVNGKQPSKVFFIRWFQNLHDVHAVDVVNSNPFIKNTDQRFIHVDEN